MGQSTLAEFRARHGLIRYAATTDEFRQLAAVAAAQDVGLVNGGYVYDAEIIERLPTMDRSIRGGAAGADRPGHPVRRGLDPETELRLRPFLSAAQRRLDRLGCEVVIRAFEPATLPALYLVSRAAAFHEEFTATRDKADDLWGGVLDSLAALGSAGTPAAGPQPPQPADPPGHRARRAGARPRSPSSRSTARRCCSATTRSGRPTPPCSTRRSSACSTGRCRGRTR